MEVQRVLSDPGNIISTDENDAGHHGSFCPSGRSIMANRMGENRVK